MDVARVRRRCEEIVRALPMPSPFDVRALCDRLGRSRRRRIHLVPVALPPDGPCGAWIADLGRDFIVYERDTSRVHQDHIVLHEVGHLLLQHPGAPRLGPEHAGLLFPNLDPAMVTRVLGRSHYSSDEEREAEMVASLALQRADRSRPTAQPGADPQLLSVLRRLEATFQVDRGQ